MTGPTGKVMLMPEEKADTDYIMVATGTGIAPYRGFIRRLFTETTPAGVEAGVNSLTDGGIPPRFVIIDDGWQSVAPDPQFKKRVDHISDHPRTKPDFIDKPHVTEVVEFGRGDAGGGALAWAGGALASGLEYAYWNALHSVAYNSLTWNVAKFLVDWVFSASCAKHTFFTLWILSLHCLPCLQSW